MKSGCENTPPPEEAGDEFIVNSGLVALFLLVESEFRGNPPKRVAL
jgi:hypothetical protein